MNSIYCF